MIARKIVGFALLIGFVAFFRPGEALAKTHTIKCKSKKGELHNCKVNDLDESSVRLLRTLKNSAECTNGRTWGTQPGLIWVEGDCRAEFEYEKRDGKSGSSSGGRGRHEITCESHNNALKNCKISDLKEHSVKMERNLGKSTCINGRTWGTQPGLIWVESGCRAVFSYETESGRHHRSSEADSGGRQELTCESRKDKRKECKVTDLDLGSVSLERTLSDSPCNRDDSWGTQRGLIWVDDGCRAVFSYRVNR